MTNKLKHNKKRNVGIIYELLVRNMTRQLLSENMKNVNTIKQLIEKHFNKKTEIYKEYKIFSALSDNLNKSLNENKELARSIIKESKVLCQNIDTKKLEKEKSNLIKSINYTFGKKFYFEHIPNYVNLATIQITLNEWKNKSFNIQNTVLLEEKIINNLIQKETKSYEELKESVDKSNSDQIVMNIMTKKINEKYKNMSADQKNLIKSYAFYYEKDKSYLIQYLNEQKTNSINLLKEFKSNNESEYLNSKIEHVMKNIKSLNENNITDDTIVKFLTISQLITELSEDK
jgi:hypothetical protein